MKKKILLIDDDKMFSELFRLFAQSAGHDLTWCADGSQAMDLLEKEIFEGIVVDYHLPDLNGAEITRRVKKHHPDALIIGFSLADKEREFLSAGADHFYPKPLIEEVISRINGLQRKVWCDTRQCS